ncbi:MAG: hypothetical protein QHH27_04260 [Clostridia bacterium]|nr:hypothetical protein [Clostridia bacterium]MDH7572754.1 hypothetical protein [Clostridia bacterium]
MSNRTAIIRRTWSKGRSLLIRAGHFCRCVSDYQALEPTPSGAGQSEGEHK